MYSSLTTPICTRKVHVFEKDLLNPGYGPDDIHVDLITLKYKMSLKVWQNVHNSRLLAFLNVCMYVGHRITCH